MDACLSVLDEWQVRVRYAGGSLPAPACYGVPDTWPHIRSLYSEAGFTAVRAETVLWARCADLVRTQPESWEQRRSAGALGTRFDLGQDGASLGFIEVCLFSGELARSNTSMGWADVGNLDVEDGVDRTPWSRTSIRSGRTGCSKVGSRPSSTTTRRRIRRSISICSSGVASRPL